MFTLIKAREIDSKPNRSIEILKYFEKSLFLSSKDEFEIFHKSFINSTDIELIENRYLLSGSGNGAICIHDLHRLPDSYNKRKFPIVASVNLNHEGRHLFSISRVQWHSVDNGLFTSSGADKYVKVWDTNSLKVATQIQLKDIINNHEMSSSLLLVAVATNDSKIKLLDLRCGSAIHSLVGHRGKNGVLAIAWRPYNEYHLISGGNDGQILLWDIRKAKSCMTYFDQHNSQTMAASNASHVTAHEGSIVSVKFLSQYSDHIISLGKDSAARLWNVEAGCNLMLNYGRINVTSLVPIQIDISKSISVAYIPSENYIIILNIFTGETHNILCGHFSQTLCCKVEPLEGHLITGGRDNNLFIWSAQMKEDYINKLETNKFTKRIASLDDWSDDD